MQFRRGVIGSFNWINEAWIPVFKLYEQDCLAVLSDLKRVVQAVAGSTNSTVENLVYQALSQTSTPIQTLGGTMPDRLKTMSLDFERDGTIDEVWTYSYDSVGRIISREIFDIESQDNILTYTFNYDGNNLISKVSSSGEQDTHVYDDAGRVISSQRHWDQSHEYGR